MDHESSFWTRRRVLSSAITFAAATVLPGCGVYPNLTTPASPASSNPQPSPPGTTIQGTVTVAPNGTSAIPPAFMGLSYEKDTMSQGLFSASNADLIALFKALGTGVLCLGGGTLDTSVWTPGGNGSTFPQITPGNVDALAGFLKATGWQCLYGVNLATSTPAIAADEAKYAAASLGSSLLGIEIGSGPDTYGSEGSYFTGNWNLADYLARWSAFEAAIIGASPGIPITGPSCAAADVSSWTLPYAQSLAPKEITLLTEQYFRLSAGSASATAEYLISPDTVLTGYLAKLAAGASQLNIPFRMAGCNSFYSGGVPGVSNSYASSLWVLDFLFACAAAGSTGVNMHGGGSIYYAPISDSGGFVSAVNPEYYGLLLFSLAGSGSLLGTQLAAGNLNATAYAVKNSSGGMNLILVNKDPSTNLHITVSAGQTISSATLIAMAAPSLTSTSGVTIQGAGVGIDGAFSPAAAYQLIHNGSKTTCYVPALGAVLISIS